MRQTSDTTLANRVAHQLDDDVAEALVLHTDPAWAQAVLLALVLQELRIINGAARKPARPRPPINIPQKVADDRLDRLRTAFVRQFAEPVPPPPAVEEIIDEVPDRGPPPSPPPFDQKALDDMQKAGNP